MGLALIFAFTIVKEVGSLKDLKIAKRLSFITKEDFFLPLPLGEVLTVIFTFGRG